MARSSNFGLRKIRGIVRYYLHVSENGGPDQMRSYHAADLHLCFHKVDFLNTWQMVGNL